MTTKRTFDAHPGDPHACEHSSFWRCIRYWAWRWTRQYPPTALENHTDAERELLERVAARTRSRHAEGPAFMADRTWPECLDPNAAHNRRKSRPRSAKSSPDRFADAGKAMPHEGAIYLICKGGAYYRPNAQGYTRDVAEAGRYTLEEAVSHSHPNGPDGPCDGITYMLAASLQVPTGEPSREEG